MCLFLCFCNVFCLIFILYKSFKVILEINSRMMGRIEVYIYIYYIYIYIYLIVTLRIRLFSRSPKNYSFKSTTKL